MARSAALAALALAVSPATAFFLMPCWPIMTERLDPIVNPGALSSHVHQIAGGNGFAPAMDYNDTQAASCTTCFVKGDHSNYWIPALYYQHQNGSMERVPQVGSASMYYFNEPVRLGPGETMETFPEGLRMLAGNPEKRTPGTDAASLAINYKCLDYAGVPTDSKTFPTSNCANGIRAEVTYPSCWDGKNLDSADHKSHMAYPTGTFESGACPKGYPHHMVTLKVEFIFDTNAFKDQWYGSSQPFVLSSGDTTGYGLHADYVMGWDHALLESAVNQCFDISGVLANCAPFNGQLPATKDTFANPGTCTLKTSVDEDVGGVVDSLPGCNGADKSTGCKDNVKLFGDWAAKVSSVVASILPPASSASSPSEPSSVASSAVSPASSSPPSTNLYSENYNLNPSSSLAISTGAFYAQQGNAITSSSSSSSSASIPASSSSPSSSSPSSSSPQAPAPIPQSSTATATPTSPLASASISTSISSSDLDFNPNSPKMITVTDLITETEWTTQFAPATAIATVTASVTGVETSRGGWKRQIGDHGHRHVHAHVGRHGRSSRVRRGVEIEIEREEEE